MFERLAAGVACEAGGVEAVARGSDGAAGDGERAGCAEGAGVGAARGRWDGGTGEVFVLCGIGEWAGGG